MNTERMDEAALTTIEARANAAFRAPWTYTRFAVECDIDHADTCDGEHEVLRVESPEEYPEGQIVCDVPGLESLAQANGEFIAHARADVPALLAEARRARAAEAELREELERMQRTAEASRRSVADFIAWADKHDWGTFPKILETRVRDVLVMLEYAARALAPAPEGK